jgi:hypothetical protein
MLRPIRTSVIPASPHWLIATNSLTGDSTPPYFTSNSAYAELEEYMDSDVDHGIYELHSCDHLKITRKLLNPTIRGEVTFNPANPSGGDYSCDANPPSTQFVWDANALLTGPYSAGTYYGSLMDPVKDLPSLGTYDPTEQRINIPLPEDINSLISHAISAMLPGLRPVSNISLINSIIELKDFRSLPRSLRNISGIKSSMLSLFQVDSRGALRLKTLRQLLRKGADAYLQAEFNVLPLLSDISAISTAIRTVRNQLRQLVAHAGSPQKRYYTVDLRGRYNNNFSNNVVPLPANCRPPYVACSRNVMYTAASFNAQMMYNYTLPSWITEDSLMAALLDLLGVNLNPRIIWNAIPWSFVVDWVANVNSWLDNWRIRNIEPVVNIRGFSWSVKVVRSVRTSLGFTYANPCVERVDSSYVRRVGDRSALYSSLVTSGLNPKEFSLAAALAFSR